MGEGANFESRTGRHLALLRPCPQVGITNASSVANTLASSKKGINFSLFVIFRSPAKSKLSKPFMFGSGRKDKDKKKDYETVTSSSGLSGSGNAAAVLAGVAGLSSSAGLAGHQAAFVGSGSKDKKKEKEKEKKDLKPKLKLKKSKTVENDSDNGKSKSKIHSTLFIHLCADNP